MREGAQMPLDRRSELTGVSPCDRRTVACANANSFLVRRRRVPYVQPTQRAGREAPSRIKLARALSAV